MTAEISTKLHFDCFYSERKQNMISIIYDTLIVYLNRGITLFGTLKKALKIDLDNLWEVLHKSTT